MGKWADRYGLDEEPITRKKPEENGKDEPAGPGAMSAMSVDFEHGENKKQSSRNSISESENVLTKVTVTDKTVLNTFCVCTKSTDIADKTSKTKKTNTTRKFIELVKMYGISHQVLFEDDEVIAEIESADDLQELTREVRQSWATGIAIRLVQKRGLIPNEWDKVAHCKQCGDVHSWHDLETLSCSWCWLRVKGDYFPQP